MYLIVFGVICYRIFSLSVIRSRPGDISILSFLISSLISFGFVLNSLGGVPLFVLCVYHCVDLLQVFFVQFCLLGVFLLTVLYLFPCNIPLRSLNVSYRVP